MDRLLRQKQYFGGRKRLFEFRGRIKIDNGLLNGSVREGVAAISVLPNYGCGGGFATYDCKVR
jgi:hypothetical protein